VRTFLERPIEGLPGRVGERGPNPASTGQWPYLWIEATYVKVREAGRIVAVAVAIAVAGNADGRREAAGKPGPPLVVGPFPDSGMAIGAAETETFWVDFLRKLKRRGRAGVKLVISDAHEGIKAAVARVFRASWQRCRVPFMRNALAHAGRSGRRVVSAFIATACAQDDAGAAKAQWRQVADQVRPKLPKLAALLDEAAEDVLASMSFPKEHRAKIHSTNPLERLNGEIKRRTEVVGLADFLELRSRSC
jgi:putative transposase